MNRINAAYKKAVILACCDALEREGFTRFRKTEVDWPLDEGFHCWVGLNTGLYPDVLHVSPFVGLHVAPIERLWTSMKSGKYPAKYDRGSATYARHLGELVPDVPAFQFTQSTDVDSEARRLTQLYKTFGLEFSRSIANYQSLLPLLKERIDMLGAYPERYACCLYLMGRNTDARTFIEKFLPLHRDYFEGFAVPFLNLLEEASGKRVDSDRSSKNRKS